MSTDSPHNTTSDDTPSERPCPECGETVRRGLVRCWNCGAFMEKKIEAHYQQMQANPSPMVFSPLPEGEAVSFEDDEDEGGYRLTGDNRGGATVGDLSDLESVGEPAAAAVADDASQVSHSEATGGDVLLQVALQEQQEERKRRKRRPAMTGGAKTPGGFIVFCPYGCKLEVKEQHRGMTGKCPKCGAPFVVPVDPPVYKVQKKAAAAEESRAASVAWLDDLHVHTVPPEKFKLKADSLKGDFAEVDFGFRPDGLLLVTLARKGGGLFGGGAPKKDEARQQVRSHLDEGKPENSLPVGELRRFTPEQLQELHVVQPAASRAKSLFQGIPVFGAGRIAIQLPMGSDDAPPEYVSMGLMQFRKFAAALAENFGIEGLGAGCDIPMEDVFTNVGRCHYNQVQVKGLQNLAFYQEDPDVELELSGWKCSACGLVISEDARQREKLGGKGGKGLAKVKCPKCQQKFGEQPFYTIAGATQRPSMSADGEEANKELEPASAG
jgi:hypothetical protein